DRHHAVKTDRLRLDPHLESLFSEAPPITPLVREAAHAWMIIPQTNHAEKIGTRKHHPPTDLHHTHQLVNECLRFVHVFENVQRAHAGKMQVGIRQGSTIVELAALTEPSCSRDVRL